MSGFVVVQVTFPCEGVTPPLTLETPPLFHLTRPFMSSDRMPMLGDGRNSLILKRFLEKAAV